jgi:ABC-type molybdate transport system permease subunit
MIMALSTQDVSPLVPSWGILGFVLALNAVLFIAALVSIARSRIPTTGGSIVWALIVLALPVLGSLLWFLIGRRELLGARLRDQAR